MSQKLSILPTVPRPLCMIAAVSYRGFICVVSYFSHDGEAKCILHSSTVGKKLARNIALSFLNKKPSKNQQVLHFLLQFVTARRSYGHSASSKLYYKNLYNMYRTRSILSRGQLRIGFLFMSLTFLVSTTYQDSRLFLQTA